MAETGTDATQGNGGKGRNAPPAAPPKPETLKLVYTGPADVFDDSGSSNSGKVFERGGEAQVVSVADAERLRSYPHNQFEVEA